MRSPPGSGHSQSALSYLLQVNSSKLLHCWRGTLRASSKSQACGCSSSCDGPSPRDGQFLGMEERCAACPLPAVWAEQLGTAGSLVPTAALHLWVPRGLWASVGGTRRFLGAGGLWLPQRHDQLQSPPHLRLASLIQLQQHRAAAAHCRTHRCPCPIDTCSVPKGESAPSLELITGSLSAQLLAEPKKPHSSSPAQAGWVGRGLCTHQVG